MPRPPKRSPDSQSVAVVFGGGPGVLDGTDVADLRAGDAFVIAADSGVEHAIRAGFDVDLLVGDLDSASAEAVRAAEASGAEIERHPVDKDKTDLAIALDAALVRDLARVVVLASAGGRLDHLISSMLVLASDEYRDLEIEARVSGAIVNIVRDKRSLHGAPGDLVTLLPAGTRVTGITTEGLRWSLQADDLALGTSRGVSNEFASPTASISVAGGTLLVIRPAPPTS